MTPSKAKAPSREAQRLETRERVFAAAIGEIERNGLANANIGAIASTAGIARGTFYFHFPTKEHVVVELLLREEGKIADELAAALDSASDMRSVLSRVTNHLVAEEDRIGSNLFRDLLSIYFVAPSLVRNEISQHPVAVLVIEQIERARDRGEIDAEVNSANSAKFFLLGLYALLITDTNPSPARDAILGEYLASFCRGLAAR